MALILCLETSAEVCSVGLVEDGNMISLQESDEPNSHTELITILIQKCFATSAYKISDLEAVAVCEGPGSYTSLRVGTATAKGLCYGLSIPLIALDSLSILAAGIDDFKIEPDQIIVPMIDARRMEVYSAIYNAQKIKISPTQAVILDNTIFDSFPVNKGVHLCGSGALKYYENFKNEQIMLHHLNASASFMVSLAENAYQNKMFSSLAYYNPNYLKLPNITKSKKNYF